MFGTLMGNFMAVAYFLLFQICGVIMASEIFKGEKWEIRLLLGSVSGSFLLHWLPSLYAFFLGFTKVSHLLALFTLFFLLVMIYYLPWETTSSKQYGNSSSGKGKKQDKQNKVFLMGSIKNISCWVKKHPVVFVMLPLYGFTVLVLTHHTLSGQNGALYSGQSTYGDMNLHLGFITSIARQKEFPPEYSICPGAKIGYPFLADSISSSLYILGCSLRLAYLLPMYFALAQVFSGMYFLAHTLLKDGKSAMLAFVLFFFNGGFGFWYFINKGFHHENFNRIFTSFYETPTNYVSENIYWHNIICDMLIPQRATLFGWTILFVIFLLLVKAMEEIKPLYFAVAGVFAGGLVLIHTHSFLALGVMCGVFLLLQIFSFSSEKTLQEKKRKAEKCAAEKHHFLKTVPGRAVMTVLVLAALQYIGNRQLSDSPFSGKVIFSVGIGLVLFLVCGIITGWCRLSTGGRKKIITGWGVFLIPVILFAVPQLLAFTFKQAGNGGYVQGVFNWVNESDSYLLFNLKNMGIMYILSILMLVFGTEKERKTAAPAVFLWLLCEFIMFQPNHYDNNKLLLVAYLFFCIPVASFLWETLPKMVAKLWKGTGKVVRCIVVPAGVIMAVFGAVLTMGREYVSEYELYSASMVKLSQWVDEHTSEKATFLTATNHNNAISSLTGRNIVCGSSVFLYYHGVDYRQKEQDVRLMYEDPDSREELFEEYGVDYMLISSHELSSYSVADYNGLLMRYPVVYQTDDVVLLEIGQGN